MCPDMTGFLAAVKRAAVEAVEAGKPVAIVNGSIESVTPLRVRVDPKLTLTSAQIIVPAGGGFGVETERLDDAGAHGLIVRENSLARFNAGDSVILLRTNGGQRYLLLGRGKT